MRLPSTNREVTKTNQINFKHILYYLLFAIGSLFIIYQVMRPRTKVFRKNKWVK